MKVWCTYIMHKCVRNKCLYVRVVLSIGRAAGMAAGWLLSYTQRKKAHSIHLSDEWGDGWLRRPAGPTWSELS